MQFSCPRGLARKNRVNCYLTDDAMAHLERLQRERVAHYGHPVAIMLVIEDTIRSNAGLPPFWAASGFPGEQTGEGK